MLNLILTPTSKCQIEFHPFVILTIFNHKSFLGSQFEPRSFGLPGRPHESHNHNPKPRIQDMFLCQHLTNCNPFQMFHAVNQCWHTLVVHLEFGENMKQQPVRTSEQFLLEEDELWNWNGARPLAQSVHFSLSRPVSPSSGSWKLFQD